MSRETRTSREIARRFLFVACLAGVLATGIFLLLALSARQPVQIFLALLATCASIMLCAVSHRTFDFTRLASPFPAKAEGTDIAQDVLHELQALLLDIYNPDTNWMIRHESRKKLASIIRREPRLLDLYGSEIRRAYPFFAGKPLKNDR